jgi:hypothetical protein
VRVAPSHWGVSLVCLCRGDEYFELEKGSVKHLTIIFNAFVFCQVCLGSLYAAPSHPECPSSGHR